MGHRNMVRKISTASFFLFFLFFGFATAKQANTETPDFRYGLYYADWDGEENALSLVISGDDRPIPPKANDPGAPTQPGFYLRDQHLRFQVSRLSMGHFSFRTQKLSRKSFSFDGHFGKEPVEDIGEVPCLDGVLQELKNDRIIRSTQIHFGHAVVL